MSYSLPARDTERLPVGVLLRPLAARGDTAGATIELYRRDWRIDLLPVQWNLVSTRANTLRGVHLHLRHWDYLCVLDGEMLLGLHDMRPQSPTYRLAVALPLPSDPPCSIAIPPGVAHGFYFAAEAEYIYSVDHYFDPSDELGCRWNDPELGLAWPTDAPLLSPRDAEAPTYGELARVVTGAFDRAAAHS
jgi:dTDP-4-dehydrorhamnose 3,5-epimerase